MQLSFYGFSCGSSPASGNVEVKSCTADVSRDRDESSQDSGIGSECTEAAESSSEAAAVFSDRTNLMDRFLSTGRLGTTRRKPVFKRSLSVPLSAVSLQHVTHFVLILTLRSFHSDLLIFLVSLQILLTVHW